MLAEFISPDDPRWTRYLDANWHDFYHLPEYVRLCASNEGGAPTAFYAETRGASFLAPLVIYPLPQSLDAPKDRTDCASPYGYSTPIMSSTEELLPEFLDAFMRTAKNQGIVTAFFRLHPLCELNKEVLGRFGQLVHHGQTVYLDLAQSDEEFWAQVRRNHKQNIQKLKQQGFQIVLNDWSLLDEFVGIYSDTMARVAATTCLYDRNYFYNLRTILGSSMHLCCALAQDGHLAAGGVFVEIGKIVHYHLSATAFEYLALSPNKLIISVMRTWARDRSNKVLHLGGGVGGSYDPLFHFKAGFSTARADFYTYRLIFDQHKYEKLCLKSQLDQEVDKSNVSTFFPLYRRMTLMDSKGPHKPYEDFEELVPSRIMTAKFYPAG